METKVTRFLTVTLSTLLFLALNFASQVEAQTERLPNEAFKELENALSGCPNLNCAHLYERRLSQVEIRALGSQSLQQIRTLVQDFAKTYWPDTVLEGAIVTQFQIRIDSFSEVKFHGRPSAFVIRFSAKAWDFDQCTNMMITQEQANLHCQPGKIVHRILLTDDLKSWLRDETRRPVFIPEQNN